MRLYYWIHHTGRYDRNTGVQRVVRNLASSLTRAGHEVVPVAWCEQSESIVVADESLLSGLERFGGPQIAELGDSTIPLHLAPGEKDHLRGSWLLLPEVPHVDPAGAPPMAVALDYARFYGLRLAAIFYDLIPIRQAAYSSLRPRHEAYARSLTSFDVVLPISRHSADDLAAWWHEQGLSDPHLPPVRAVLLPAEMPGVPRVVESTNPPKPIRFTAVGTVEPRKNQVEALQAYTRLRARRPDLDLRFELVGGIHPTVHPAVSALAHADESIRLHDYRPDEDVRNLVEASHATVFLSLYEGFGLPVAESLWLGTPCLCSNDGSIAEIAAGGGCLGVSPRDGTAIESAFELLATDQSVLDRLTREARERPLKGWAEYASDVISVLTSTPPLREVISIEGTKGGRRQSRRTTLTRTRPFHWHPGANNALLPGKRAEPRRADIGEGALAGTWAVIDERSCADPAELGFVIDAARALGLRVAVNATGQTSPSALAAADLSVFTSTASRDQALARALRELPRTVGLRRKMDVAPRDSTELAIAAADRRLTDFAGSSPPRRVYYWTGLTVEQPFNTGVQRVTRQLAAGLQRLGLEVVPVKWDDGRSRLAQLTDEETAHLARWNGPMTSPRPLPDDLAGAWLIIPEVTVPVVPEGSNPPRVARALGMRVAAVFYDLIPAKMPENYPDAAHRAFAEYWRSFAEVDVALPISWSVVPDLVHWLEEQDLHVPQIVPCVLAGAGGDAPRTTTTRVYPADQPLVLLSVGTWEPRKNYARLLRALKTAQEASSRRIELTIVGRRAGFQLLDAEIEALAAETQTTLYGHVDDEKLELLHESAAATVFASVEEGFGLPVMESLWHGLPCVCHDGSAMAELTPGGGALAVDMRDEGRIADALVALAEDPRLLPRLTSEATQRPIRTWDEYAEDVRFALTATAPRRGWPLSAVAARGPLLTCAITTYNRAQWLRHSLPRLLDMTRPWRDIVEVVVCDNASTDDTPDVVRGFVGEENFHSVRNRENVGMLGNLAATARASSGAYVWLLGDDDLLIERGLENVLEGLARHPDVEIAYVNYAYTRFDEPAQLEDLKHLIDQATPIATPGPSHYASKLRQVAALNENLFTAIYTCAFRRDHALRAYQLDTGGPPFTSLSTCVPSSVYALRALQNRPAWWVGEPAVVVNMNVSWLRWALLWHLERMPDLFEEAELRGIDPTRLDVYRLQHLADAGNWIRSVYFEAEDAVRQNFSLARLLERTKHLEEFRMHHLEAVRAAYADAYEAGRVVVDAIAPEELFARYGV